MYRVFSIQNVIIQDQIKAYDKYNSLQTILGNTFLLRLVHVPFIEQLGEVNTTQTDIW